MTPNEELRAKLDEQAVLHGPFDLATHKATFTNYLEVVVTPDGTIIYAVPSHQRVLERIYQAAHGVAAEDAVPRERWLDMLDWLMEETGCVCAYTAGVLGRPTTVEQEEAIAMLRREGLICE